MRPVHVAGKPLVYQPQEGFRLASPQKENGYTAVANEILDVMARTPDLGGAKGQVLFAVLRKTYGWHKKEDSISVSQLVEATGLSRRCVIYTVQELEARRILSVSRCRKEGGKNEVNIIRFNKNYDEWVVHDSSPQLKKKREYDKLRSARLRNESRGSARPDKKVVHDPTKKVKSRAPTKERKKYTKETSASHSDASLIVSVIDAFKEVNPTYSQWYGNTTQRGAIGRLIQTHGLDTVLKVVGLLPKTNKLAYFPSITTPRQLETDWAKLESKLTQEKAKQISRGRGVIM